MKRRKFLTKTGLGAIGATALGACNSQSEKPTITRANTPKTDTRQPSFRWRMATSWPKSLQILFEAADLLCQKVNNMTKVLAVIDFNAFS